MGEQDAPEEQWQLPLLNGIARDFLLADLRREMLRMQCALFGIPTPRANALRAACPDHDELVTEQT